MNVFGMKLKLVWLQFWSSGGCGVTTELLLFSGPLCHWMVVCIYRTPLPWTRSNTSRMHLVNIQISFLWYCDCLIKVKEPSMFYYLLIAEGRIDAFPKGICTEWDANCLIQDLNLVCWFYFLVDANFSTENYLIGYLIFARKKDFYLYF